MTGGPPLTRAQIVDAAMQRAASGSLGRLTIRELADELDVTPMALYRHVRDKDDILEAVTDALLAEQGLPDPALPWPDYLAGLATGLRAVLREHPSTVAVFTRRPQMTTTARARLVAARDVLTRAGCSIDEATRRYAAVHTYTIGFCALEAGRRASATGDVELADDELDAAIAGFVSEEQFEFGLRALVAGLGSAPSL
jgi:AcrR family transcriptional regulator